MSGASVTRVGLVGAGAVGRRHATVLSAFDDVRVVAVADVDLAMAQRLADDVGARAYEGHERMLDSEQLDALYICVPPFAHGPPERAALAAMLPFFVEKPLAADWATAKALADEVAYTGLPTGVGYHWRQLDTVQRARELLDVNPARLVVGYWLDRVPPPPWWLDRTRSGGQTIEQTTHVLDLVRLLAGEVEHVSSLAAPCERSAFAGATIDDASAATLRFATGAVGSIVSTCVLTAKHRAGIEAFADGLALALTETELALHQGDGSVVSSPAFDGRRAVDRDFIDTVRGARPAARVDYHEALRTHRVACALVRSAQCGAAVPVNDEALEALDA